MSAAGPSGAIAVSGADETLRTRVATALAGAESARFAARLWMHDDSLWGDDPAHRKVAANRLGWLDAPRLFRSQAADLEAFAHRVASDGYTHAVLLGMGGSSLCPEVLRLTFGVKPGALDLAVLDNTSPAAVRAIEAAHDPARTLFVVASKSGGTVEVTSFERHFFEWVRAARGADAGRSFVAITDPGTSLAALAEQRGYRHVFTNPADIGGRYSALSLFGLVPAALLGVDLPALLDAALAEAAASSAERPARDNPGLVLGTWLGTLAASGRDKLTLVFGDEIAALGTWVEQLVAESTGKTGKGIVPVAEEALGAPGDYRDDRVFVASAVRAFPAEVAAKLDALAAAGHPVLRWTLPGLEHLGAEFLRWEYATATAGAVLGVDPFDEPNVTEAKTATKAVLARFLDTGALPGKEGAPDAAAGLRDLLAQAKPGDYVALLAYVHATPERHAAFQALRHAIRAKLKLATTLGYGPRFLHSTGQLHKGGANNGVFVQFVADESPDVAIPGEKYGFEVLRDAQASGDYEVLKHRGRRVVRIALGRDVAASVEKLAAVF